MTSVKLTRVWTGETETKFGSKLKMAIKCEGFGDKWLSTFKISERMKSWKEGDTVEINITEKAGKDGTKYLNFEAGFEIPTVGNSALPTGAMTTGQATSEELEEFIF